ncbi:LysE family translocator [Ciceribacter azotifigens]|uniref:LysE family translocator n=1 Tax=Ciceribacter azotifigens TaxID=2069303 RepID=UPI003A83D40B
MAVALVAKGILLGLAIAAPLGPIGALCINRTLERGFWAGVAGGLGTALADGAYALMAAAGFAAFAVLLETISIPLQLCGGAFLLWLGWTSFRPRPPVTAAKVGARDLVATTVSTFFLTITNPATILSFAAIFAGLGLAGAGDRWSAALLVLGVFAGSMLWWFFLSGLVAVLHHRLPPSFSLWVSRISGVVLIGFGLAAIAMGFVALAA